MTFLFDGLLIFGVGILLGPIVYRIDHWAFHRLRAWIKANGKTVFYAASFFAVGILIGFALDRKVHDATVGFIGSFAGVAAAIGGALWVWEIQDERARSRTTIAIAGALRKLSYRASGIYLATKFFCDMERNGNVIVPRGQVMPELVTLGVSFDLLESEHVRFTEMASRYESRLIDLEPFLQTAHGRIETGLQDIRGYAARLKKYTDAAHVTLDEVFFIDVSIAFTACQMLWNSIHQFRPDLPIWPEKRD